MMDLRVAGERGIPQAPSGTAGLLLVGSPKTLPSLKSPIMGRVHLYSS